MIDEHPNHFLFTVVRNPYDRIVSSWNHFRKHEQCSLSEYIRKAEVLLQSGFAALYRQVRNNRTGISPALQQHAERAYPFHNRQTGYHVLPMSYFVASRDFDFVGRYEQLEADWITIARTLGKRICLPHLNRRHTPRYRDLLAPEDFDRINRVYADDFSLFRYHTEPS